MKLRTTSLLSVAALLAVSVSGRAQLAPYSREELDSLFVVTIQSNRDSGLPLNAPLLACVALEKQRENSQNEGTRWLEAVQPSFVGAADKVSSKFPRAPLTANSGGADGDSVRRQLVELAGLPVARIGAASGSY